MTSKLTQSTKLSRLLDEESKADEPPQAVNLGGNELYEKQRKHIFLKSSYRFHPNTALKEGQGLHEDIVAGHQGISSSRIRFHSRLAFR